MGRERAFLTLFTTSHQVPRSHFIAKIGPIITFSRHDKFSFHAHISLWVVIRQTVTRSFPF